MYFSQMEKKAAKRKVDEFVLLKLVTRLSPVER